MKIIVTCHICSEELREKGITISKPDQYGKSLKENFFAEFGNDFLLKGICPKGHKYIGSMAKERYDILLESAIYSYLSGFEMEAVLSFAASLERAQELYIWTSMRSQGVDLEEIESFWKPISTRSECQLGSFLSQWLAINKTAFPVNKKITEFRNKVVHKGHIPLKEETAKFANWVTDRLFDIVESLRSWQETYLREITFYDREERCKAVENFKNSIEDGCKIPSGSLHTPYMTNLNHGDMIFKRESFEQLCDKAILTAKSRGIIINKL